MPNTPVFHKGTQQPLWFVHTKRHHKRHKSSEVGTMFKVKMAKLKPENGLNRTLVPVYKCIVHVQLLFYYTKAQEACRSHAPRGVKNTLCLWERSRSAPAPTCAAVRRRLPIILLRIKLTKSSFTTGTSKIICNLTSKLLQNKLLSA